MSLFLCRYNISNHLFSEITYEKFIDDLKNRKIVCKNLRTNDAYEYFLNLVTSLLNSIDLTLIDFDFSEQEIENIFFKKYTPEFEVSEISNDITFSDIQIKIQNSSSKITIFTSGTTGQPKAISHSISNLLREIRVNEKYNCDIWAFAYNPTHIAGLQLFFQAFLNKNNLVYLFLLPRDIIHKAISHYKVTNISATPTFYRLLFPMDIKYESVCKITLGGERLNEELIKNLQNYFPNAQFYNIYASTEFGTIMSSSGEYFSIKDRYRNFVKFVDNVLFVHKSLLGVGENIQLEGNDWYKTNDIVEFLDLNQHFFKFKARENELINVGGSKVNPNDIESELLKIKGINSCRVYGRKSSLLGNIVCADVQLNDESELTEVQIKKILSGKLQSFKVPRKINIVDAINTNRAGKLDRKHV